MITKAQLILHFWRSCIEGIQESGGKLRWLKGISSLITIPSTFTKVSDQNIQKLKCSLKELISYLVKFSPNLIQLLTSEKSCPHCERAFRVIIVEESCLNVCIVIP